MTTWQPYTDRTDTTTQVYEPYPTYPTSDPGSALRQLPSTTRSWARKRPSVGFQTALRLALKNWNNFSGRASRSEFWYPAIVLLVAHVTVRSWSEEAFEAASAGGLMGAGLSAVGSVLLLVYLAFLVPMITLGVRRLHDTNRSGWLLLLALLPIFGWVILGILLAQDSQADGERFDDPRRAPFDPEDL